MARKRTARAALVAACLAVLALALGAGFLGCRRTPQLGADEEVYRAVDALFTAVTARDEKLLGDCERRLHAHRDAGRLRGAAARELDQWSRGPGRAAGSRRRRGSTTS